MHRCTMRGLVGMVLLGTMSMASAQDAMTIPGRGRATLATAPDGTLGQVLWQGTTLIYRTRPPGRDWQVETVMNGEACTGFLDFENLNEASLIIGADGTPHVLLLESCSRKLSLFRREASGWSPVVTHVYPANLVGTGPGLEHVVAAMDAEGSLHVVIEARDFGVDVVDVVYGVWADQNWTWEFIGPAPGRDLVVPEGLAPRTLDLALDRRGAPHVIYQSLQEVNCFGNPDCIVRSELAYAVRDEDGWIVTPLQTTPDPTADAGLAASIAIDSSDRVHVLAFYLERVQTGSPQFANLQHLILPPGGTWQRRVVASTADGYAGNDGPKGTGFAPDLIAEGDRLHLVFSDYASSHFPGFGAVDFAGQLRYGFYRNEQWSFSSIYRQFDANRDWLVYPLIGLNGEDIYLGGIAVRDAITPDGNVTDRSWWYVESTIPHPDPLTPFLSVQNVNPRRILGLNYPAAGDHLLVSFLGAGTVSYAVTSDQPWLQVGAHDGTNQGEQDFIPLLYDRDQLAPGSYTASVTVAMSGAVNSPQVYTYTVTLRSNAAPVRKDLDGDGVADFGVYHPPSGTWYRMLSSAGFQVSRFGFAGTVPLVGDWDGDGITDFGCYFAPLGNWYRMMSTDGFSVTQFGFDGTTPIVGDWDGDGRDDYGCYYPPTGDWYRMMSTDGFLTTQFGFGGTVPIVGDWDGDGRDDIGCYFPPTGNWYRMMSTDGFSVTQFGFGGTQPIVADWDGDGRDDFGCYHPPTGNWYRMLSTDGFAITQFGFEGTIPLH